MKILEKVTNRYSRTQSVNGEYLIGDSMIKWFEDEEEFKETVKKTFQTINQILKFA